MKDTTQAICIGLLLAGCATSGSTNNPLSDSILKPEQLETLYQDWLHLVAEDDMCSTPKILKVLPKQMRMKDAISETWVADVCGKTKKYYPILKPDGHGGYEGMIGRDFGSWE